MSSDLEVIDISEELRYLQHVKDQEHQNHKEKAELRDKLKSAEDLNERLLKILAEHGIDVETGKKMRKSAKSSSFAENDYCSFSPDRRRTYSTNTNTVETKQNVDVNEIGSMIEEFKKFTSNYTKGVERLVGKYHTERKRKAIRDVNDVKTQKTLETNLEIIRHCLCGEPESERIYQYIADTQIDYLRESKQFGYNSACVLIQKCVNNMLL